MPSHFPGNSKEEHTAHGGDGDDSGRRKRQAVTLLYGFRYF